MAEYNETTTGGESESRGAGEKVKEAAHQAQDKASHVAAKAREKSEHLVEEGREKADELAHRAGEKARSRAQEEKGRVAGGIRTVADALRRGSQELPEDRRVYGRFVETVADRAEDLSRYLEERDVDDMAREARRFAREHTGVVISSAFALGLLGARFLKSSADDAETGRWTSRGYTGERTYETGYRTSGGYPSTRGYDQPGGYGQPGGYARGEVYHAGAAESTAGLSEPGRAGSTSGGERDRERLAGDGLGGTDIDVETGETGRGTEPGGRNA